MPALGLGLALIHKDVDTQTLIPASGDNVNVLELGMHVHAQ